MENYKVDPRTKIIFFIVIFTMIFISRDLAFITTLSILLLVIILLNKKTRREILPRMAKIIPLLVVAFILWSVLYRWSLFYSYGSVSGVMFDIGLFMAIRLFLILLTSLLFISVVSPRELVIALEGFRIPYKIVFTLGLTMRHMSTFAEEYMVIREAQSSRGLELDKGFLIRRIRNYIPVIIPLLIRSIENAEKLSLAMDLKLFSFKRRRYNRGRFGLLDITVIFICIIALLISTLHYVFGLI